VGYKVDATKVFSTSGSFNVEITESTGADEIVTGSTNVWSCVGINVFGQSIATEDGDDFYGTVAWFTDGVYHGQSGDYTATIAWVTAPRRPPRSPSVPTASSVLTRLTPTYSDE